METSTRSNYSLVFVICLYLCLLTCPTVTGKCYGKWAIHSCWGGNGKRSMPSYASSDMPAYRRADRLSLRDLLLSDHNRLKRLLKMSDETSDDADDSEQVVDLPERGLQLGRLKNYLLAMKLKRALRTDMEEPLL